MEELTRIRTERGWSQQRLADESGVDKATINQIERGRRSPNVNTLEKLAEALGSSVADFFPKAQAQLPLEFSEAAAGRLDAVPGAIGDLMRRHANDYDAELRDPNSKAFRTVDAALDWIERVNRDASRYIGWASDHLDVLQPPSGGLADIKSWRNALDLFGHSVLTFRVLTRRARKRVELMAEAPDELAARRSTQQRLDEAEAAAEANVRRVQELAAASG